MEEESCFLSKEDNNKLKLRKIFETVINDLNEKKVTTIVGMYPDLAQELKPFLNFELKLHFICFLIVLSIYNNFKSHLNIFPTTLMGPFMQY